MRAGSKCTARSSRNVGDARTLYPQSVAVNALQIDGTGVPYGSRTRVAAVKEKRPIVIECNFGCMDSTLPPLEDSRDRLLDL